MTLRAVSLPADVAGTLWLSSMPGRLEPWADFLVRAHAAQLGQVVCLTPLDEVRALSPAYAHAIRAGGMPFAWRHLPTPDFGVSSQAEAFREGVLDLAGGLRGGSSVMLHCAAGIGRTGTTAACVLKALGCDTAQALQAVRRAGSNPQSAVQSGLVNLF